MERRTFLGGLTAASFGVILENSFTEPARARTGVSSARQDSFETSQVEVSGNAIFVRRYGNGPAILLENATLRRLDSVDLWISAMVECQAKNPGRKNTWWHGIA
jgi:hypothetical protein